MTDKKSDELIKVTYIDFIRLCQVDEPNEWMPFTEICPDGIYRIVPSNDPPLSIEERAILSEHPTGHYDDPLLRLPCSLGELVAFLKDEGASGSMHCRDLINFIKMKRSIASDIRSNNMPSRDKPMEVGDYIRKRKAEGASNPRLAHELFDKDGPFHKTDLEISRLLNLGTDLNEGQINALKMRAHRVRKKWEKAISRQT